MSRLPSNDGWATDAEFDVPPEISAWAKLDALAEIFGYDFGRPIGCTDKQASARAVQVPIIEGYLAIVIAGMPVWAGAAFTQADLLWRNDAKGDENLSAALQWARSSLDRALINAPHSSGAWLMLAGLASRLNVSSGHAIEFLKLSYYTGPSEQELLLLRLQIAVHLESFSDIEMRQLMTRDIRLLLAQKQDGIIGKIYGAASANAKAFLEQTIREIDPSAVDKIRTGEQKPLQLPH